MLVKSEETLDRFRGRQRCGMCNLVRDCEPHHCKQKGLGGGSRLDVDFLLIAVCRECHNAIHNGKTKLAEVLAMVSERVGMPVEDIIRQRDLFLRAPKECKLCPRCGGKGVFGKLFVACGFIGACSLCMGSGVLNQYGEPWEDKR